MSVCVAVAYPDVGRSRSAGSPLVGSAEQIAETFDGFRALGIAHLIVEVAPFEAETLDRLTQAVEVFRSAAR